MATGKQCGLLGSLSVEMSDEDVFAAMKAINGYLDITPADFLEVYRAAFRHAVERLSSLVKARDIMTEKVVAVKAGTPLAETAKIMEEANISGVPVVDEGRKVIGIISEKDFLLRMRGRLSGSFMGVIAECLSNRGCIAVPIRGKTAADIMTKPVITAFAEDNVSALSQKLAAHGINRIPVTDALGELIGIVTRKDIVDSYCARMF
ncbi:MAG: CBS domain-containing protein [Deltaproteobacteria bacterium]|nr:CBS domain-containing protein [Deltaproteobacteria bacterium]